MSSLLHRFTTTGFQRALYADEFDESALWLLARLPGTTSPSDAARLLEYEYRQWSDDAVPDQEQLAIAGVELWWLWRASTSRP
ncbi:MAG: hypothetical protein L0227_12660 [Chloroflexi bacterium]|nr:hypothetical protein [Chloroflexota bacterium]